MQTNLIHRTIALTLALLLLCSSVGFSMDMHFCKDQFKGISFFGEAESCHTVTKTCPNHGTMLIELDDEEQKDCCSNQTLEFDDLDSEFNMSDDIAITNLELKFLASFIYAFCFNEVPVSNEDKTFIPPSPLIVKDIYVLNETFLI